MKPDPKRFLPYAREGMDAASGVLVGSRHTAESLWAALDDPDPAGEDAPRPARRGHVALRPRSPRRSAEPRLRAARRRRCVPGSGRRRELGPRPASGRPRRSTPCRRRRPARRPGRQADRLQGRRPAARGLAARPRREPRRAPADGRLRRVRAALQRLLGALWRPATSGPPARSPRAGGPWRAARRRRCEMLGGLPGAAAAGLRETRRGGCRQRRVRRPARARGGRPPGARPPTRWSFPAPSPRRSGWSPRRRPRPACCRCRPAHSGAAEVSRALAASPAGRGRRAGLVPARRGGGARDRQPASTPGWAGRPALASGRARSLAETASGCGAGRAWRGACSPPRRVGSTSSCRVPAD